MKKFAIYIFTKWIIFYGYQFIESGNKLGWNKNVNIEGLFLSAFMLLALPILELLILFFPIKVALKNKGLIRYLTLILCFASEFVISWTLTNQQLEDWLIVEIILSIALFYFFYRRELRYKNSEIKI